VQVSRRAKRVAGASVAAAAIATLVYLAFFGPTPQTAADFGSGQLLYQHTSGMYVLDLERDDLPLTDPTAGEMIFDSTTFNLAPAPTSPWVAVVEPQQPDETEPVLSLLHTETRDRDEVGFGLQPQWNDASTHVAYLRPTDPASCTPEGCGRDTSDVVILHPGEGTEVVPLHVGRWEVLGWAGDHVLIEATDDPASTVTVSLDGSVGSLEIPAENVFAPSPDGRWVVFAGGEGEPSFFVPLQNGSLAEDDVDALLERYEIPLERREALIQGAWSPDSERLAMIVKGGRRDHLRMMSPDAPHDEAYPGSEDAFGRAMWMPQDPTRFAYVRFDEAAAQLEGVLCPAEPAGGECEELMRWELGVAFIRLQ
jgi:hypothetical protein